jgi:hypothetical protein
MAPRRTEVRPTTIVSRQNLTSACSPLCYCIVARPASRASIASQAGKKSGDHLIAASWEKTQGKTLRLFAEHDPAVCGVDNDGFLGGKPAGEDFLRQRVFDFALDRAF